MIFLHRPCYRQQDIIRGRNIFFVSDQRSVRSADPLVREGSQAGHGEAERERRSHRARTPARSLREPHHCAPGART